MGKFSHRQGIAALAAGFALAFACASTVAHADQASAQVDASRTHDRGSNDSLHESYGNALNAVSNFYEMNIPGAVGYGLKAYGQYRNSNQFDDLRDRNKELAGIMSSAVAVPTLGGHDDGSAPANIPIGTIRPGTATAMVYASPYARLDKAFLHEGATGEVAAKFEKLSGMSREKMFDMMVDVHANSKFPTDPDFVPWAMKTYHDVAAKMPNPEFRQKLEGLGGYLEQAVNSGMARSVLAKFQAVDKKPGTMLASGDGAAPVTSAATDAKTLTKEADAKPASAPVFVAAVSSESSNGKDDTGLQDSIRFSSRGSVATGTDRNKVGLDHLSFEPVDGYLADMMKRQRETDTSPTIFQTVSSKLKELSVRQHLDNRSYVASGTGH